MQDYSVGCMRELKAAQELGIETRYYLSESEPLESLD